MTVITYGTGTPSQFTSGENRQVLEMGNLINYFNPSESPLLTISSRMRKNTTPVPEFEWMEDEYFIQRSIITTMSSATNLKDSATAGNNDTGCIVVLDKTSYLELFERGGIYAAVVTGSAALESMVAYLCIAIGDEVDYATTTDKMVQFLGIDTASGSSYTFDKHTTGTDILSTTGTGTLQLTYVGTGGAGSLGGIEAARAAQDNLTDNDVFTVRGTTGHAEGADVHKPTRKKVRRILNCTEIFRESYNITGTQKASKMYGPYELDRLQARKLKKIKTDVEWGLLTHGAISLDAASENPQRTFASFGVGNSNGVVQSLNGNITSSLQLTEASFTMTNFDDVMAYTFEDQTEGSDMKDCLCSQDMIKAIAARVRAESTVQLNTVMGKGVYAGFRVTQYMAPIGTVNFIRHPMLRGSLVKFALLIDWKNFEWRPLRTRDLQLGVDIVKDGSDGQTDEWLLEGGPAIMQEQTHAIWKLV